MYALTEKAFPREVLDVFSGMSEAVVTDHPEWTGAYSAETKEGGYFSTDPLGNFTYARDEERDDYIVSLVESGILLRLLCAASGRCAIFLKRFNYKRIIVTNEYSHFRTSFHYIRYI